MGVLEKITQNQPSGIPGVNHIAFKDITPDSTAEGICYVRGGEHRFTKADKPFIKLYIQDTTGHVIPGYIFDLDNFKASGLELTRVIHSLIKVTYKENFLPRYGLTIIIDKLEMITTPTPGMLDLYVGSLKEAKEKYSALVSGLSVVLDKKVAIPYDICNVSYMDYAQGEIGGLAIHYWDMFNALKVYATKFSAEEQDMLWGTFVLYIFTHSNYLRAEADGSADISLVSQLTMRLQKYMEITTVSAGALELVHIFFGYEPKDIFVRLVVQVSENLVRAGREINLYQTLPISREGNAGYGTVRRYS